MQNVIIKICFTLFLFFLNLIFPNSYQIFYSYLCHIGFFREINIKDEKYYYREGRYKGDMYEQLVAAMDDENAIYQWRRKYVRKNKSGVVPTLTANQGEGGHNVCLIKTKHGIRKMTPHECFNTQGFPYDFKLPVMSDARLYKQAGNSVCVSVIHRIAEQIKKAVQG